MTISSRNIFCGDVNAQFKIVIGVRAWIRYYIMGFDTGIELLVHAPFSGLIEQIIDYERGHWSFSFLLVFIKCAIIHAYVWDRVCRLLYTVSIHVNNYLAYGRRRLLNSIRLN